MPNQVVEILLKSGGPWAAALIAVCWFFIRELRKKDDKIREVEALHKTSTSEHAQLVKDANDKLQTAALEHAKRIAELQGQMHLLQAEHFTSRLKDSEAFRKAYIERQEQILSALTESTKATEENSAMLDRLEEFLQNKAPPRKKP